MNRSDAWALVCEYTTGESLRKHMLAVEAAMRAYARRFGEDEEKWGAVGLLHDFDYERWPNPPDHPLRGAEILARRGYPDDVIYGIKSHADYLTDCPRVSRLDKALYACDELAGFITAVAPSAGGARRAGSQECEEKAQAKVVRGSNQSRRHRTWSSRSWRTAGRAYSVRDCGHAGDRRRAWIEEDWLVAGSARSRGTRQANPPCFSVALQAAFCTSRGPFSMRRSAANL